MSSHRHKCGLTEYGFDSESGCGFEWEHQDPDGTETEEIYAARHVCPNCGRQDQRYRMDALDSPSVDLLAAILQRIIARNVRAYDQRLFKQRK